MTLATTLDLSKLALRILHNRWYDSIQPLMHKFSTNHRLVLMYMNLAHNVFTSCDKSSMDQPVHIRHGKSHLSFADIIGNSPYFPRSWLSCFIVNWAVNVDKVRECNSYIMYMKVVYLNNCHSKITWSYHFFADVVWLIGNNLMSVFYE